MIKFILCTVFVNELSMSLSYGMDCMSPHNMNSVPSFRDNALIIEVQHATICFKKNGDSNIHMYVCASAQYKKKCTGNYIGTSNYSWMIYQLRKAPKPINLNSRSEKI